MTDPLPLAQALIRCASVTPADAGAQDVLAAALAALGFRVTRLAFGTTPNLYARRGDAGFHLCFAGHTDVVPPGDAAWSADPFGAELRDDTLIGRGACDMKGAIAAFVAACTDHLPAQPRSSVSLLITGDEEGPAQDGTARVLEWMAEHGEIPDFCIVGEPTSTRRLGDTIKIGRRGSLNAHVIVDGVQGHVAYPARADNPVHRLVAALGSMLAAPLDSGTAWFEPSSVQVTSVDVGNAAANMVPARAEARLNIRFNDQHSAASLQAWLGTLLAQQAGRSRLETECSGEAFLTEPGLLVARLRGAIARAGGIEPRLDTGGGTSDARFIARYCPVAEFGLVGRTMHQADERVPVGELRQLAALYRAVLAEFAA